MADKLSLLFDLERERLDLRASDFGNNKSLKQLRLKLEEVYDLLHRTEDSKSDQNPFPNSWFSDMKDLVCDVDQLIDDCEQSGNSKAQIDREVSRITGSLARLMDLFHKFVDAIDEETNLISLLDFLDNDYVDLGYQLYTRKSDLIKIILGSNKEKLRVVPIRGQGGVGKTFLAERIYNDLEVKSHFELRVWVSIGKYLDAFKIAKAIAVEFAKTLSTDSLFDLRLREALKGKKIFIVLDDVRDAYDKNLELLKLWLNSNIGWSGSCVLITTHSVRVASYMGTVATTYLTCFPKEDDSEMYNYGFRTVPRGHFSCESEHLELSDAESEWAAEIVAEDEMTLNLEIEEVPTREAPLMPFEMGYITARAPETVESISDTKERIMLMPEKEFQAAAIQSKGDGRKPPIQVTELEDAATHSEGGDRMLPTHVMEFEAAVTQSKGDGHMPPIHVTEFEAAVAQSEGGDQMLPIRVTEFEAAATQSEGGDHIPAIHVTEFEAAAAQSDTGDHMLPIFETKFEAAATRSKGDGCMLPIHEMKSVTEGDGSSNITVMKTIDRNVQKVFGYVKDITATKIGVHGNGGIGKTTLLKSLIDYPEIKSMFDVIILVNASRYWSTRKIQNEVLGQLLLCREDSETDSEIAEKLFQVLNRKKFLLLLDDVWEHIDLRKVGIPDPSSENGCKILITSRKLDVCQNMKVIDMEAVSRDEAWEIFYEQVGAIIDLLDILPFAQAIVKGCDGLPLLLIVTGRALSGENNVSVWERASRLFSLPSADEVYYSENVIQLLKFSFDQLKDGDIKSCFLHCGLFPEDQEVDIFEFLEYCIQERIITGSRADAHKRGKFIVDALVCASLLQVTESGHCIKMHDLIRDLAVGILLTTAEDSQFLLGAYSRLTEPPNLGSSSSSISLPIPESSRLFITEDRRFLFRAGAGLTEPPSEEEWQHAKMIFLMDNELCTLPERPNCSKLLMLFIQRNYQLRVIPSSFFDCMASLQVLNLSKTRIKSLPKTLFKLKNLEILILRDCERLGVLSSEVGSLQSLEVLDLGGTEISKLPGEIGKLASLRHLEVSFYGPIDCCEYSNLPQELISSGTLSSLSALETLSIVVCPGDRRWNEDVKFVITEVSNLTKLRSLCLHFPRPKLLELFLQSSTAWNAQLLTEFKFVVGHDVKKITSRVPDHLVFDYNQQVRCLRFVNGEKIPDAVVCTLACSTAFYLDHHLDICSLTNFGAGNINGLKFCIISECPKIETVVDSKELTVAVFPSLENLSIHHLWNLTFLWEGIVPKGSFAELRILSVHACPKLRYVFSTSMIQFVSKLEQLVVEDCPAMAEIIHEVEILDSGCIILSNLKKLKLHYLPGLVKVWTSAWAPLEHVSFYDCPRLKNIGADSKLTNTIMEIKAEQSWWDALEWENNEFQLQLQNCFTAICEDDL